MVMIKSGFCDGWVISKNIILESEQELVWSHALKTWQQHDCFYTALVFHIPGWTLVLQRWTFLLNLSEHIAHGQLSKQLQLGA